MSYYTPELVSVSDLSGEASTFILLYVYNQLFQYHLLKRLFFPHLIFLTPQFYIGFDWESFCCFLSTGEMDFFFFPGGNGQGYLSRFQSVMTPSAFYRA